MAAAGFVEQLWPLTWLAFVPLLVALPHGSPWRAFFLGWWTEAVIIWLGFYWLVGTMVRYGFISLPLSLLFFAVIGIGNGVRLGLFAGWLRLAGAFSAPWWYRLLLPACTYVALDYLFPRVFPWYLGVTQFRALPLIQSADLVGVHGITFLLLAGSSFGTALLSRAVVPAAARRRMGLAFAGLFLLNLGYGLWQLARLPERLARAPSLRLAVIQPNIGIGEKGRHDLRAQHLARQVAMSLDALAQHPALIVWPETMYPFSVSAQAQRLALPPLPEEHRTTHWLVGALTYAQRADQRQVFNSALLVGPDSRIVGRYDKQRLLAFGEYIPLQRYLPFLRGISPTIGNLTPGAGGLVTLPQGITLGPLICYEDILPALSRQAVRSGAQLLVNLTNDAWFGDTRAPYLHRMLAAFRAIEHRVYLVRATNTGLTSIIDPLGREGAALPLFERGTLIASVQPLRLSTVYTRLGDWFAQICSVAALVLPLWHRRRGVPRRAGEMARS
ncbi:MAG: apolipoprotein N-acyltransferase [Candidatus Tectimicrobiota bacterium]|nr:MAG: apolipoprotein N-acyltransferase [Candidatus Tectomicrobia bacterium]